MHILKLILPLYCKSNKIEIMVAEFIKLDEKALKAGRKLRFDNEDWCIENHKDEIRGGKIWFDGPNSNMPDWAQGFKIFFNGKLIHSSKTFKSLQRRFDRLVLKWNLTEPNPRINVETEGGDITVKCPHCDNWESQPIDQQRHHLQTFEISEWLDTEGTDNIEVSLMTCKMCEKMFELSWIYN